MSLDGFTQVFENCREVFEREKTDYSKFREDIDKWWFLLGNSLIDINALNISNEVNPDLLSWYLSVPKSKFGYTENVKWRQVDELDSRHIMMSTIITNFRKVYNNVVEIGGGFGNWYRLNKDIIQHENWYILDLPFVLSLQENYLKNEIDDISKIKFISSESHKEIPQNIDLVIAAHSLSELSWETFLVYYRDIIMNTKYLFYASHKFNCGEELLTKKMNMIESNFTKIHSIMSEGNLVYNNLYINNSHK